MKSTAGLALCLALLVSAVAGRCLATADDWPMPRHDALNTGLSSDSVKPPFRLAWRKPIYHSTKPGSLLASGGAICITRHPRSAGESTEVTMISEDGRILWQLSHARGIYLKDSLLVIAQDHDDGSTLEAWDWKGKKRRWQSAVGGLVEQF